MTKENKRREVFRQRLMAGVGIVTISLIVVTSVAEAHNVNAHFKSKWPIATPPWHFTKEFPVGEGWRARVREGLAVWAEANGHLNPEEGAEIAGWHQRDKCPLSTIPDYNVVGWGSRPRGVAATTFSCFRPFTGEMTNAFIIFNKDLNTLGQSGEWWTGSEPAPDDALGRIPSSFVDVKAVAVHEWGHWQGFTGPDKGHFWGHSTYCEDDDFIHTMCPQADVDMRSIEAHDIHTIFDAYGG